MNYRHAYHAGNIGDVLKHAVLAHVLTALAQKDAPFFALDMHAGAGDYDLSGTEAAATGEWQRGVGRLEAAEAEEPMALKAFLAPWRSLTLGARTLRPQRFPGSPALIRAGMRLNDRAAFFDKQSAVLAELRFMMRGDRRILVEEADGWIAGLKHLPPRERRGLILMDPPYEETRDYVTMVETFAAAQRRFATGTFMLWYPVKGESDIRGMTRALIGLGIQKTLRLEVHTRTPNHPNRFDGAGLIVINPPWTLFERATAGLPALAELTSTGPGARALVEWLVPERS